MNVESFAEEGDLTGNIVSSLDQPEEISPGSSESGTLVGDDLALEHSTPVRPMNQNTSMSQPNLNSLHNPSAAARMQRTVSSVTSSSAGSNFAGRPIPVLATLEDNERLKNENMRLLMSERYLKSLIPFIEGKNGEEICKEYADLRRDHYELKRSFDQLKEDGDTTEKRLADLETYKLEQDIWAKQMKDREIGLRERINQLQGQLDSARERYPDFDESVDSIFGDAKDKRIDDLDAQVDDLKRDKEIANTQLQNSEERVRALQEQNLLLEEKIDQLKITLEERDQGERTFAVGVGDLNRISYEQKIDELTLAIDARDAKIKIIEDELQKTFAILKNIQKSKEQAERQLASLTTSQIDYSELHKSMLEERREETMNAWLERLNSMEKENNSLRQKLAELGAIVRSTRATAGADSSGHAEEGLFLNELLAASEDLASSIGNGIAEISGFDMTKYSNFNLSRLDGSRLQAILEEERESATNSRKGSDSSNISNGDHLLEMSMQAKDNVETMRENLHDVREQCRMMFERLQGSANVLELILTHINGDQENEVAELIRNLRLDIENSMTDYHKTSRVIETLETSINDVCEYIERSMNESEFRLAAFHQSRLVGGGLNDSQRSFSGAGRALPESPRRVMSDAARLLNEEREEHKIQLAQWAEDRAKFTNDIEQALRERAEVEEDAETAKSKLASVSDQLCAAQESLREQELSYSNLKSDMARIKNDEEAARHEIDRLKMEQIELVNKLKIYNERDIEEVANVRSMNEEMKIELSERAQDIKNLQRELDRAMESISTVHEEKEEIERKKRNVDDRIADLITREDATHMKLREAENTARLLKQDLDIEKSNCCKYVDQFNRLDEELDSKNNRITDLQVELANSERAYHELKQRQILEEEKRPVHQSRSIQTSVTGEVAGLEKTEDLLKQISFITAYIRDLASLRGDTSTVRKSTSHSSDIVQSVLVELKWVEESLQRALRWTSDQTMHIEDLNSKLADLLTKEDDKWSRSSPAEISLNVKSEQLEPADVQRKAPEHEKKFKNPLRQDFFELTNDANELVQTIKAMNGRNINDTYANVVQLARDLRTCLNNKYHAVTKDNQENHTLSPSDLLERVALLTEQNTSLSQRLLETRKQWKETKEKLVNGGGCAMDSEIAKRIGVELAKIHSTLNDCQTVYKNKKSSGSGSASKGTLKGQNKLADE